MLKEGFMDLLTRLLIACLSVWFIDQMLAKLGVKEPVARAIQIIAIILALLFVLLGWMLTFVRL